MAKKGDRRCSDETRARIVLEATTCDPKSVCEKYGINQRTLQRWRKAVRTGSDTELSRSVADKKRALDQAWAEKIPGCLGACVDFLRQSAKHADSRDPHAIHAVAGAMKLVSEVAATWKLIDAGVLGQSGSHPATPAKVPATAGNVTPIRRSV